MEKTDVLSTKSMKVMTFVDSIEIKSESKCFQNYIVSSWNLIFLIETMNGKFCMCFNVH